MSCCAWVIWANRSRRLSGTAGRYGVRLDYSYDGEKPIGTAAALRQALPSLGPSFLTLYGDSYLEIDYRAICERIRAERRNRRLMTVIRHGERHRPAQCLL